VILALALSLLEICELAKEKNVVCEACGQPKMFNFAFGFGKLAE
jgi:hypothetical protein